MAENNEKLMNHEEAKSMADEYLIEVGGAKSELVRSQDADTPDAYIVYDNHDRALKRFFCRAS